MNKIYMWLKNRHNIVLGIIPGLLFIIAKLLCYVNSYYFFDSFTSSLYVQVLLLIITTLMLYGSIGLLSKFFCLQTQNLSDTFWNLVLLISSNGSYLWVIINSWDGRNWYYFLLITFVLLFNSPFCLRCISFYKDDSFMFYFYVTLMYVFTYCIIAIMWVYLDMNSMSWHLRLGDALKDIGTGYITSIVFSWFIKSKLKIMQKRNRCQRGRKECQQPRLTGRYYHRFGGHIRG